MIFWRINNIENVYFRIYSKIWKLQQCKCEIPIPIVFVLEHLHCVRVSIILAWIFSVEFGGTFRRKIKIEQCSLAGRQCSGLTLYRAFQEIMKLWSVSDETKKSKISSRVHCIFKNSQFTIKTFNKFHIIKNCYCIQE